MSQVIEFPGNPKKRVMRAVSAAVVSLADFRQKPNGNAAYPGVFGGSVEVIIRERMMSMLNTGKQCHEVISAMRQDSRFSEFLNNWDKEGQNAVLYHILTDVLRGTTRWNV